MSDDARRRRAAVLRSMLPVALLILGGVAALAAFGRPSIEDLGAHHAELIGWRDRNVLLAVVAYVVAGIAVAALSVPGTLPMTLAAGFLFGLVPGTLLATGAATLGATLIFLAVRTGPAEALRRAGTPSRFRDRVGRGLAANPVSYLLLLRLVPVVPFAAANVAPAFFGVTTRLFLVTTFLGILPGTFVTAWIGVGLGDVFGRGGTPDLGLLLSPQVLAPTLGLAALAALPILLGALRRG